MKPLLEALLGVPIRLPEALVARWPELDQARYRRGGAPPRIGGWLLGVSHVSGVALGGTIWLGPRATAADATLLLHEIRHVQQFRTIPWFALRYVWQTVSRGYRNNAYEIDARAYAARRFGAEARTRSGPGRRQSINQEAEVREAFAHKEVAR